VISLLLSLSINFGLDSCLKVILGGTEISNSRFIIYTQPSCTRCMYSIAKYPAGDNSQLFVLVLLNGSSALNKALIKEYIYGIFPLEYKVFFLKKDDCDLLKISKGKFPFLIDYDSENMKVVSYDELFDGNGDLK